MAVVRAVRTLKFWSMTFVCLVSAGIIGCLLYNQNLCSTSLSGKLGARSAGHRSTRPFIPPTPGQNAAAFSLPTKSEANKLRLEVFQGAADERERLLQRLLHSSSKNRVAPRLTDVNCSSVILTGNASLLPADINPQRVNFSDLTGSLQRVLTSTANCTEYVISSGFLYAGVSKEELAFPLAFSLLVYKDLDQVERLLRAVYRPHNVYCLHADRKSHPTFQAGLRLIAGCLPNVFLLDRSVDVQWGKITVVEPEIECMKRAWEHRTKWKYFINLTGQEFPLKTNKELVRILAALDGANEILGTLDKKFHFRWRRVEPVPYDLQIIKGSVHMLASRGYVDYVVNSPVSHALYEWLRPSFIPDETFFTTLNNNPQLGVPGSYLGPIEEFDIELETIRSYKVWEFSPNATCSGQWVRYICQYGVGDLPRLTSSPFLVANKFTYGYQPLTYDCLEKWYFHKVAEENDNPEKSLSVLNLSFYRNRDIVRKHYTGPILKWQ